ncbi:MAG: hypothetical protein ABFS02_09130 [Pseudomonadota bacterium]
MTRIVLLTMLSVLFAACASSIQMVGPGRRDIASLYSVDPQRSWSAQTSRDEEIWTVDGPALQSIRFVKGLKPGDNLFGSRKSKSAFTYKTGMNSHELMELILDSFRAGGMQQVEASLLQPFDFGGREGFRIDFTFMMPNSLEMQGIVFGAEIDDRLHLIFYYGTRQHYFEKYREQAERLAGSIRFLKNP